MKYYLLNLDTNLMKTVKLTLNKEKYVSRGGLKFEEAYSKFNLKIKNNICLDIGSSTGGFTDFMLQHKADRIYAVDCGTNQLH